METADLQLECNPLPFDGSLIHQFRGAFGRHPAITTTTSAAAQIIGCEERATGQVSRDIYWLYLTAAYGGAIVILLILVQFVWQMFQIASDYWIAYETSESESPASKHPATAGKNFQAEGFIRVYAMLALGCAVCVLIRSLLVAFIGITTSQKFYDKMLHSVFRAPMSFFDTTPLGRVLSRVILFF
jgi:ATP-binding cassette subfamily C (CFTR/MRP) protein 1